MATHVFTKRPGTTDRGHDFENYFIANLLLKLITDDDVEDFYLSSDDNDYGSFDDVVVEILYRSGHRQIYAIQLKHLEERNLTVAALESDKGKFAVKNYFKNFNFQNDYTDVILYTNASLQATNGQVLNLGNLEKTNIWKTSLESELTTSRNGEIYYLRTENSTDFRSFCKHFSLYTNQANVTKLEQQTRESFQKIFGCKDSAFTEYVNFVGKWCKLKGKKEKLNKEWIRNVIAVCILKPFVLPLSFSSRAVNENTKVLREAISLFQTTVFDSGCYEKVRELWSDFKEELTDVKRINRKYSVTSDFVKSVDDLNGREKEISIMLWLLDKCPLILTEAPEVYRAIEVFKEKKFVIFNPKFPLQSKSVFEKLSDLEEYSRIVYDNIVNKYTCSFQEKKEVTLKNFFHGCQGVGEILTTNELLQMVDGPLIIGGVLEVLPACHVPRRIAKNIVNTKYLEKLANDSLIVIDNFPNLDEDGEFHITTIKEFLKGMSNKENKIHLCKGKCSRARIEELCQKTNKINYHYFCYLSETFLEHMSSWNINEIQYFIQQYIVEECHLYQIDNDINIICANPGMGKTTLMKSLKNNIPSSLWTVLIYARNHSSYFRTKKTNISDFLNHCLIETELSIFDQSVIRLLVSQRRIVILWDGLDELVDENLEIVKKLIHDAKVQGYKQWMTSRIHLKSTLEDEFNTVSMSLTELHEKEQMLYVSKRLNLNEKEVSDIFTKIKKNIALFPYNNILGIPLQSFMLTELFLQDKDKYLNLVNEIFSLADLYEHFVEDKFEIYFKEKHNLVEINEVLRERNEQDKELMVNSYEVAAIQTYFDKKIVRKLQIASQNVLLRSKKDPVGFIINTTNDGLSEFCHNSFGEYFAALYLTKNHSDFFVTFDLLFEAEYDNIRLFYDLILSKGCKGHISVLYRNYELLTTCTDDEICKTDKFGRSTLEVACTWRKKYPVLQITKKKVGKFKFEYTTSLHKANKLIDLQKILSFLVTHLTPDQTKCDLIVNESLLLPFVSLKKDDLEMGDNYWISVLLYGAALDFSTIFDFFENIPFIYCMEYYYFDDDNLLTISLKYNSINCLEKIVIHEPYRIYISKKASMFYDILKIFQSNSRLDIMVDVVRDIDINVLWDEAEDEPKYTLLRYACDDNNYDVAAWLLKNGATISLTHIFGDLVDVYYDFIKLLLEEVSKFKKDNNAGMECPSHAKSVEIVAHFLEIEALANHINRSSSQTFLDYPRRKEFAFIGKLLLENNTMLNTINIDGRRPIHHACLSGNGELLTLLIENGADVNVKDKEGNTPLHLACRWYGLTKILIDYGADLFALNDKRESVVHLVSDSEILLFLIKSGIDLHARDRKGRMLIHNVCSSEHHYSPNFLNILIQNTSGVNAKDKDEKSIYNSSTSERCETTNVSDSTTEAGTLGGIELYINKKDYSGKTPLHYAINSELELVEYLLKNGSDPNLTDENKQTPLHYACASKGKYIYKIVSALIRTGAIVNLPDAKGRLPLHYACISGHSPIVTLLVHHQSNIKFLDKNKMTPLHYAYKHNHSSIVTILLETGAKIDDPDGRGKLLIHYACIFGRVKDVKLYLENGVDVNVLDKSRKSPLHYACKNNRSNVVRLLVANGANTNIKDVDGKTPLFYAKLEVSRFLIENTPADVNVVDNDGLTLLHHSASNGDYQAVELLIENGAKINIADKAGRLPIHLARSRGTNFEEMVKLLTNGNCTINALDNKNKTPVHYACQESNWDLLRFLIRVEANLETADKKGRLPIHLVCGNYSKFCYGVVKTLIDMGVALEIPDHNGQFPIHYACRNSKYGHDVIKVLTEFGASVNVVDHDGKLPIHHACISGLKKNLALLIELGASVNAADTFQRTPIHYSSAYGHVEITKILLENDSSVNFSDVDNKLPIHYACLRVHQEISKFPDSCGFSFKGISSYHFCSVCRQEAKKLAEKHEFNTKTGYHVCEESCYKTVELLLKYKSRVDVVDSDGKSPADYVREYYPKVVEIFEIYKNFKIW